MSAELKAVTSDFYDLEALLDDEDRALLHRVRAFMDTEVQPIINEYWTKAKFPRQLIPGLAELGIAGTQLSGYGCPGKSALLDGMIAMELSRATRRSRRSWACTAGWRWARCTSAAPRSRRSAGCRRWPGWSSSAPSG
jgi:alkylation response protein AidB-like acyl-CoA dehydrogenase